MSKRYNETLKRLAKIEMIDQINNGAIALMATHRAKGLLDSGYLQALCDFTALLKSSLASLKVDQAP